MTNWSRRAVELNLTLEVDADFADKDETKLPRRLQNGKRRRKWQQSPNEEWELTFDYRVEHDFNHQGDRGTARLHRGIILRITAAGSKPRSKGGRIGFDFELAPHASWYGAIDLIPILDGTPALPLFEPSFKGGDNRFDSCRRAFLSESTTFKTLESETLAPTVIQTLERAQSDLAALRLYDLDQNERAGPWLLDCPFTLRSSGATH